MAFGARQAGLVVLFCLLGSATATRAQEKPAGTWTEPPVRGAAGPQDGATGKPPEPVAEPPRAGKASDRTTGRAEGRDAVRTAEQDGRAERSTKLRRAQIRREAARAAEAEVEAGRAAGRSRQAQRRERLRLSAATQAGSARDRATERAATSTARPNRAGQGTLNRRDRDLYAYRAYPATPRPRYAWPRQTIAEDMPPREPLHRMRREGWGNLLGDSRARRIADAQAAGYIVMRSRTIEYPDGTRVRSLRPYEPDFDPLD